MGSMSVIMWRFNPSNGIGVVHARHIRFPVRIASGFNPSNGIGVVHAKLSAITGIRSGFQSLKRDRGGSCSGEG